MREIRLLDPYLASTTCIIALDPPEHSKLPSTVYLVFSICKQSDDSHILPRPKRFKSIPLAVALEFSTFQVRRLTSSASMSFISFNRGRYLWNQAITCSQDECGDSTRDVES